MVLPAVHETRVNWRLELLISAMNLYKLSCTYSARYSVLAYFTFLGACTQHKVGINYAELYTHHASFRDIYFLH